MSTTHQLNNIAMSVLSAALFAFGGKTLLNIAANEHGPEKAGYTLPLAKAAAGPTGGAAAPAAFSFAQVAALLPKANADAGADTFKKCAACHTDAKDAPNKVGPNLWGVIGRPIGKVAGFNYSDAVKNKGGNWTWEELGTYIHDPKETIPGNKMQFPGVTDTADLADLLAYLRKQADAPADLPK